MRDFSNDFIAQIESGEAMLGVFVDFEFDTVLRYTDKDIDLYLGGNLYIAGGMQLLSLEDEGGLSAANMRLALPNTDRLMTSVLLNTACRGKRIVARWAAFDATIKVIASGIFFYGELDDYRIKDDIVEMICVSEMIAFQERHMIRSSATCWKPFKGIFCSYDGSESWCDQTYERCSAIGNADNFGGSRWLPEISEQELWWGRVPG